MKKKSKKQLNPVLIILSFVLVVIILLYAYFRFFYMTSGWQGIKPNQTTYEEVVQILGEPIERTIENDLTWYNFDSGDHIFPYFVAFENRKLVFINAIFKPRNKYIFELYLAYGLPQKRMYTNFADGYMYYIYAQHGTAVMVDVGTGKIDSQHFFEPISIQDYLKLI